MKLVSVQTLVDEDSISLITNGQIYESDEDLEESLINHHLIKSDDRGVEAWYEFDSFITLKEHRNKVLKGLLYG